jgi:hypothetical protein
MIIPFMLPSREKMIRFDSALTLAYFQNIMKQHNVEIVFIDAQGSNIPRARNSCMDLVRDNVDYILMYWMDNDIVLPTEEATIQHLIKMLERVAMDSSHRTIVACDYLTTTKDENGNYEYQMRYLRTLGDDNFPVYPYLKGYMNTDFTSCDIKEVPLNIKLPLKHLGASGFGLCVGWFPTKYVFHADRLGEDIHFWNDNPELELIRYNAFTPNHAKVVLL